MPYIQQKRQNKRCRSAKNALYPFCLDGCLRKYQIPLYLFSGVLSEKEILSSGIFSSKKFLCLHKSSVPVKTDICLIFLFPIMVQAFRKLPEKMFFAVSTAWILPEKINNILALDFPSPGRLFLFMAELLRFPKLLAAAQHLPLFFPYVFQHKNTAHAIKKDFFMHVLYF